MINPNINTPKWVKRRKSDDYFWNNHTSIHIRFHQVRTPAIPTKSHFTFHFTLSLYWEIIKVRTYINLPEGAGYPPLYSLSHFQNKFR